MRNLKVSVKLLIGFLITVLLAIMVGVAGIVGVNSMVNASGYLYAGASPLAELASARENFQTARAIMWEVIIHTGDYNELRRCEAELMQEYEEFDINMNAYGESIVTEEAEALWNYIMDAKNNVVWPYFEAVLMMAMQGTDAETLMQEIDYADAAADALTEDMDRLFALRDTYMSGINQSNIRMGNVLRIVVIALIVVAVATSLILAFYISGLISKPINILSGFMQKAGTTGDVTLRQEDVEAIGKYAQIKDEIGVMIKNTAAFVTHVIHISEEIEQIAQGDLSTEIEHIHADDVMANSLQKTMDSFNSMFAELRTATVQVSRGSKQLAIGAQILAQGSTEQAAATEQLSASVSEIEQQTMENADMAGKAAALADTIKDNAEKGSRQMDEMLEAVKEINQAGQSISKVIKVIDDIAFQTNILALNAAVEAARAGQHGKGFAVVAEEVRNLAAKSAQAAKETGSLIINSTEKAELGSRIAGETAESLADIVSGINESSRIVAQIAMSSKEQSASISQINLGIDQVAQSVRENSATAEKSAASTDEISKQATLLEKLAEQFKLRDDADAQLLPPGEIAPTKQTTETDIETEISEETNFGKY